MSCSFNTVAARPLRPRLLMVSGLRFAGLVAPASRLGPARAASSLPSVTQPSFWTSLIPKPFRASNWSNDKKPKSREWNPATFYIVIFLLIGSNAIQMIALKRDFATFMRQADVRIGLLREVVEKIQRGERVDVERVLGTGDPQKEKDWEEVLREIEREDTTRSSKKQDNPKQVEAIPTSTTTEGTTRAKTTAQFF